MTKHIVGIAEVNISGNVDDLIIAPNLGSCLGIAAYDPLLKRGGVVHCLLPLSMADKEKAKEKPCMYVDTGVAFLLETLLQMGSKKRDLVISVAGGANINDEHGVFEIGKRNYIALRKMLWKNDLLIAAEHVGDAVSRTLSLDINSGDVFLKIQGERFQLR